MQDISIISMVFTAVLALGCLFLIISPLFKWEAYLGLNTTGQDSAQIKESLLTTLNEIEFEYKMDKISHVDYKNLKSQYETQISSIMKEEESLVDNHVDKDLMLEVEREIEATMQSYKKKKGEGK
ncbi:hypothetical protein [Neobacillus sp. PS3-40]|jgi:hypothetical protein|uniref:hypothetical protein n=1 Tax=Neobacillus sp. PS3-40 TaxID=3070679 RepID=UPI0027DFFC65|nr:hypothetical protein [Neobacillus sp. PS3-40]WML45264.1 hypothetical protein RCG20_04995 [Neobacillus sp. PS3-40]